MASGAVRHRGPAQVHTIDNDVILLRQVDFRKLGANITDMLRNTDLRPGEKEGDQPWFLDGYVSVDHPRNLEMSRALLKATKGYGIARTDTGEMLATFETDQFQKAARIAERAKPELAIEIALSEEDGDEIPAE